MTLLMLPLAGRYGISLLDAYAKSESLRPHVEEIQQIATRLQGRQVYYGVTGPETYRLTWLRPEVMFRAGGSYLFDPAALMGLATIAPPAEALIRHVADCRCAVWLLPAEGEPLSYIYHRDYARVLHERYDHTETIGSYALWTCKTDAGRTAW